MQGDARRCAEMRGDAGRCGEMRGDAGRCDLGELGASEGSVAGVRVERADALLPYMARGGRLERGEVRGDTGRSDLALRQRRLLLISAPSARVFTSLDAASAALSEPARSTRERRPTQRAAGARPPGEAGAISRREI